MTPYTHFVTPLTRISLTHLLAGRPTHLPTQGVGINSILQNKITDPGDVKFVVCAEECTVTAVERMCAQFEKQDFSLSPPLFMPILQ